jgi:hypothetical protein
VLRFAPVIIEVLLLIYCLIDCIQTPEAEIRNLPKWAWILLILIVPLVGGVAWLVAGRPAKVGGRGVPWPAPSTAGSAQWQRPERQVMGPDDDPEFLRQMQQGNAEQERLLKRWEDDLREREERLRNEPKDPPDTPAT